VCWNPDKKQQFTGGEPVVKPPKCFAEVTFTFQDPQLAELQMLSDADDVVGAGQGYYALAKQYDKGTAPGGKCLEKVRKPSHVVSLSGTEMKGRANDGSDSDSYKRCVFGA
jgi:hypothetical protein